MNSKSDKWKTFIAGIEEIQSVRVDRIKTKAAFELLLTLIETNDKLKRQQSQDK